MPVHSRLRAARRTRSTCLPSFNSWRFSPWLLPLAPVPGASAPRLFRSPPVRDSHAMRFTRARTETDGRNNEQGVPVRRGECGSRWQGLCKMAAPPVRDSAARHASHAGTPASAGGSGDTCTLGVSVCKPTLARRCSMPLRDLGGGLVCLSWRAMKQTRKRAPAAPAAAATLRRRGRWRRWRRRRWRRRRCRRGGSGASGCSGRGCATTPRGVARRGARVCGHATRSVALLVRRVTDSIRGERCRTRVRGCSRRGRRARQEARS